jgi:hypothetical protein
MIKRRSFGEFRGVFAADTGAARGLFKGWRGWKR